MCLMLLASLAFSFPVTYKAQLFQLVNGTKATGLVSITITNSKSATGYFYATGINKMMQAFFFNIDFVTNDTVTAPPPIWIAFNATYGPISGSVKVSFNFNPSSTPSSKNLGAAFPPLGASITSGSVGFVILTSTNPDGELGAWINPPPQSPSPPPLAPGEYAPTSSNAKCGCGVGSGGFRDNFLTAVTADRRPGEIRDQSSPGTHSFIYNRGP